MALVCFVSYVMSALYETEIAKSIMKKSSQWMLDWTELSLEINITKNGIDKQGKKDESIEYLVTWI